MNTKILLFSVFLCVFVLGTGISTVSADDSATGQVSVTSLTIDPEVLMPGDTAMVTAVIKNSGTT